MTGIQDAIFFICTFLSVYVQVFFLLTFLQNRKKILIRNGETKLSAYPAVTIAVPSFNEEETVENTLLSLLNLNYPKDKIKIFLIDDGSTDGTLDVMRKFENYPNIKVFHKENGGKATALNLGLEHADTEFFACLDSDSIADSESLVRLMSYFERDQTVMAVVPAIIVCNVKSIIQKVQRVEYNMSVYIKKMLSFLGAIHVTPGPLAVFKMKVFHDLGPYRGAHNSEDMEIAYRMQKHHYKIEHCNDAYVYTNIPPTVFKLYKQRVRWIYGFINNTIDYRKIFFRKEYGNFSIFTVPSGIISIITATYIFCIMLYNILYFFYSNIIQYKDLGFLDKISSFDPFFIQTSSFVFISIFLYCLVVFSVILGQKIVNGKFKISLEILYSYIVLGIVAPFWLMKAIYNTILHKRPEWK